MKFTLTTLCTYQCKAPLPYIWAAVGERWGMVGELTANLPPGSGDLSLYTNLLNQNPFFYNILAMNLIPY